MIQKKIEELKKSLKEQTLRVEQMMDICAECYQSGDCQSLEQVAILEKKVNEADLQLEKTALYILALRTPHAKTLREVLMIRKVNTDLERIADLCDNNKVIIGKLAESSGKDILRNEILQMLDKAKSMFLDSLKSFFVEDSDLAKEVCRQDDVVDNLKDEVLRKLIRDKVGIEEALLINNFSKNIERIADLTTNIAEGSIFIDEGKEVRHWFK